MYPATVQCDNVVEVAERMTWANERGMHVINRTWEVINNQQHVTFNFENEKDATWFVLRWS